MKDFEKYVNMIRKMAHNASKNTGVEYEELEAQGYMIYCQCLKTYDPSKGVSFSTHLYSHLMILTNDATYLGTGYSRGRKVDSFEVVSENHQFESAKENISIKELLECAKLTLSIQAYEILSFIVSRTWENESTHKPTISMVMEKFNMKRKTATKFWNECKSFWLNEGTLLYA